jgi:hypothetical protein
MLICKITTNPPFLPYLPFSIAEKTANNALNNKNSTQRHIQNNGPQVVYLIFGKN